MFPKPVAGNLSSLLRRKVWPPVLIAVLQNSLTCQGSHFAKQPRYARSGCVGFWGSHLHFGFVIPLSTKQHTLIGDGKQHIPIWYVGFPRALWVVHLFKWLPQAPLPIFLVPQPYNIKGKSIDGTWEELWQCLKPQQTAFNGRLGNLVVIA